MADFEIALVGWAFLAGFNGGGLVSCFVAPVTSNKPKWLLGIAFVSCLLALAVTLAAGSGVRT
jgi:hypothetical protein